MPYHLALSTTNVLPKPTKSANFVLLKRFLAILLSVNLLLAQTPLQQFLKLPLLFHHFHHHHDQNLSVSDFLNMHYMHSGKHHSDHDEDMQLPFKKHDQHFLASVFNCIKADPIVISGSIPQSIGSFPDIYFGLSSTFFGTIWQPPQAC